MCWRSQNHEVVEAGSHLWKSCGFFLCLNGVSGVSVCACCGLTTSPAPGWGRKWERKHVGKRQLKRESKEFIKHFPQAGAQESKAASRVMVAGEGRCPSSEHPLLSSFPQLCRLSVRVWNTPWVSQAQLSPHTPCAPPASLLGWAAEKVSVGWALLSTGWNTRVPSTLFSAQLPATAHGLPGRKSTPPAQSSTVALGREQPWPRGPWGCSLGCWETSGALRTALTSFQLHFAVSTLLIHSSLQTVPVIDQLCWLAWAVNIKCQDTGNSNFFTKLCISWRRFSIVAEVPGMANPASVRQNKVTVE